MFPGIGIGTRIEAENYTAMSCVLKENTSDVGGGQNVGWIDNGDWMDYLVSVSAAGRYTMNFRLATAYTGAQFVVKNVSGTVLATVPVAYTQGWQSWTTWSATVNLAAGTQTIRLQSTASAGWNLNWLEVIDGMTGAAVSRTMIGRFETSSCQFEAFPTQPSIKPTCCLIRPKSKGYRSVFSVYQALH